MCERTQGHESRHEAWRWNGVGGGRGDKEGTYVGKGGEGGGGGPDVVAEEEAAKGGDEEEGPADGGGVHRGVGGAGCVGRVVVLWGRGGGGKGGGTRGEGRRRGKSNQGAASHRAWAIGGHIWSASG